MAKIIKLTDAQIKKLSDPGRHCVDSAFKLYLEIKPTGFKTWIVRDGKTCKKLADYDAIALSHVKALLGRESKSTMARAFRDASLEYINLKSPSWRSYKSLGQWNQSLTVYVYPFIGSISCDQVRHGHILKIASPIWKTKPETCRRVIQRISAILSYEHRRLHLPFIDPTDDLSLTLGKQKDTVTNHPAPTVSELKTALAAFSGDFPTHRCFRFMVFTISRSGEARHARFDEVDKDIWIIPGDKMKAGKPHRVPLTKSALACIDGDSDGFLFPNKGKPLSDMAISMMLRKANLPFVPHGIRSCFRSWCAENSIDFATAELCLAHSVKDKVVAAYQRSDLLDKRRAVLESWEEVLTRE